ncbi:DEAD/DEAH box helicase, partial [Prevotella copri]|nr:DEAD/DEAH box helicase [Segatella copri]
MMELFDYQKEMVERIGKAFGKLQSVMVQMPTGTGKTYLLAAVVKSEERRVKNPCVWVVAHRRELVVQIEETLARFDLPTSTDDDTAFIKVMSIQWLTLHYREMREEPSLIVIDEAHHAVAKTYAEVMRAFPKAKKLGLTATPYRLKGEGFADLFDTLLTSWSMDRFIAKGRLSLYDYYSIKPDGLDQRLIDSLKKRGADGDYLQKELNEVMDVRPSLERLCMTVKRYVARKKGIVYAFSIE